MRLAKTRLLSTLALAMKLLHAAPVLVAFLCISHTFGLKSSMQPTSVSLVPNTNITRRDSSLMLNGERWTISGANVYWLGLDENVIPPAGQPFYAPLKASYPTFGRITEIMNTLLIMGATAIRGHTLGISVGNPLSVMPELGVVNEQAFDTMDWAIYEAGRHGLRIFAPLIDNYDYYHGGKYTFLRWAGFDLTGYDPTNPEVMQFYTNQSIIDDFKNYIKVILTRTNQFTGLTYAEDPTIFAYETGNELGGPIFGDMWVPNEWTEQIASYIKELAPTKLVIDGTYGVNATHLSIPTIDIFSDHFYPPDIAKLQSDISLVQSVNKAYVVGEYDWTGNVASASPLPEFFSLIEASPFVSGDLFWSLFMHDVPDCTIYVNHTDGETLQYGNPENTVQTNTQISEIRQHLFRMQGRNVSSYLPPVPCPGY